MDGTDMQSMKSAHVQGNWPTLSSSFWVCQQRHLGPILLLVSQELALLLFVCFFIQFGTTQTTVLQVLVRIPEHATIAGLPTHVLAPAATLE